MEMNELAVIPVNQQIVVVKPVVTKNENAVRIQWSYEKFHGQSVAGRIKNRKVNSLSEPGIY